MMIVNTDGKYSLTADNVPAGRLLTELLTAARMMAGDISVMTGQDPEDILEKAYGDIRHDKSR